jgi:lambda family phage minor tail protein L
MAVAAWSQNTAYSLGDIRRPSLVPVDGLFFKVSTAGTSGSTEPVWTRTIGETTADGTVVWTAISSVYEDVSTLAPNTIIELFELQLKNDLHGSTDTYRWHNGCNANVSGNITFASQAYTRQPIEATGFTYSTKGTLPRPTLTIANTGGVMTTLLLLVNDVTTGNDLGGATVRRIRTLKKFLDGESAADPNARFPTEIWYVDRKASENRNAVVFELASEFDLPNTRVPKRQLIGNICQWAYRSTECSYSGSNYWKADDTVATSLAQDKCGKRVSSCKLRFGANNELPFGSFPTAGRTQ